MKTELNAEGLLAVIFVFMVIDKPQLNESCCDVQCAPIFENSFVQVRSRFG